MEAVAWHVTAAAEGFPSLRSFWNLPVASPVQRTRPSPPGETVPMLNNGSSPGLQGPHLPARLLRSGRPPVTRKGLCRSGVARLQACDPTIRHELVARVRREIAAGTYDTEEKMDAALARLLERLD